MRNTFGILALALVIVRGSGPSGPLVAASPKAAQATTAAADWVMGLRQAGPLTFGSALEDVRRALGDANASLVMDGSARCGYLSSPSVPRSMTLMFVRGRLARIDVVLPGPRTESGTQVGDTEESVVERYGARVNVVAHPFLDEPIGHYVMYQQLPSEHDFGLIFETRHGRVTSYRVGGRSAVSQIDGCR